MNLFAPVAEAEPPITASRLANAPSPSRTAVHPQAVSLLGEVLARLQGVDKPVVLIMPSGAGRSPDQVAFDLAVAAASHLGKALLVSASTRESPDLSGARELAWRMSLLLGGEPDAIMPDAQVAGLFHAQPVGGSLPIAGWKNAFQDFRMILLDCPPIATNPQTLAAASSSDGAVLTVTAGSTRLHELRSAQRQLASARVQVLGAVLHGAPRIDLSRPWRRFAA